jgi:hypothetical protein
MAVTRTRARARKVPEELLKSRNQRYRQVVSRPSHLTAEEANRFKRKRRDYLRSVQATRPVLGELLEKRERIKLNIRGKSYPFSILMTGMAMKRFQRPVVVVLDWLGRKHLFYKSTGVNSGMPGKWLPFASMKRVTKRGGYWWYKKYDRHPNFTIGWRMLGEEIARREKRIDFKGKGWDMDVISEINTYFSSCNFFS